MTNFEKYKTAKERAEAFREWARKHSREAIEEPVESAFAWLDIDEEEKPLPCPFCGNATKARRTTAYTSVVECSCCEYRSIAYHEKESAIDAHNRVAKAVMDAKAKEADND